MTAYRVLCNTPLNVHKRVVQKENVKTSSDILIIYKTNKENTGEI